MKQLLCLRVGMWERGSRMCVLLYVSVHIVLCCTALCWAVFFCFAISFVWLDIKYVCYQSQRRAAISLCACVCVFMCVSSWPDTPPRAFEANIDRGRAMDCYTHGHTHRFRENSRWDCGKRWLQTQTRCSRPNTDQKYFSHIWVCSVLDSNTSFKVPNGSHFWISIHEKLRFCGEIFRPGNAWKESLSTKKRRPP